MADAPRVLLVDDDASTRTAFAWLLEDSGLTVIEAKSLADARTKLDAGLAVVILDVHLGDGLGTSLVDEVRAHASSARVVVMSGTADPASASGVDLVLVKAAEPEQAVAAVVALARSG